MENIEKEKVVPVFLTPVTYREYDSFEACWVALPMTAGRAEELLQHVEDFRGELKRKEVLYEMRMKLRDARIYAYMTDEGWKTKKGTLSEPDSYASLEKHGITTQMMHAHSHPAVLYSEALDVLDEPMKWAWATLDVTSDKLFFGYENIDKGDLPEAFLYWARLYWADTPEKVKEAFSDYLKVDVVGAADILSRGLQIDGCEQEPIFINKFLDQQTLLPLLGSKDRELRMTALSALGESQLEGPAKKPRQI